MASCSSSRLLVRSSGALARMVMRGPPNHGVPPPNSMVTRGLGTCPNCSHPLPSRTKSFLTSVSSVCRPEYIGGFLIGAVGNVFFDWYESKILEKAAQEASAK